MSTLGQTTIVALHIVQRRGTTVEVKCKIQLRKMWSKFLGEDKKTLGHPPIVALHCPDNDAQKRGASGSKM